MFSVATTDIQVSEQSNKRFFSVCHKKPSVGVLSIIDDKILLIKQYRYLVGKTIWALPPGGIEQDEAPRHLPLFGNCLRKQVI
ncbi:NUDIX domain-containing protein [Xenorhabdus bovienii]|uniref:NUDIX domain-containing protein n=1 Tax=Xenorhabdus bovienii TaxID=40576 RepID=A0AAJ1J819_XENBV|nr:NUDIX domain-containing protein [Xenorhabdus bovienii]MDE1477901.1 NUDIX domain-containing protein [Xenorhabdus bovienii]MDE1486031.1 NUDIX domain-containing protein [Xenorhabdus bovienii]MDE1490301.1 NUDIX domain-containing protein [Xenorhabdus bovienii]MDE1495184.1 NUDIX domain-containing protein [Xenorhabdus bovienii]MDE9473268.1 NUDIX domain-containing protein [Xenorhabdus bovienii]